MNPTINDIRNAATALAQAHAQSEATATGLRAALEAACTPIYALWQPRLDEAAETKAHALEQLRTLLESAPQLFKNPRSIKVDGVRTGYRKEADSLDYDNEAAVIKRIRALVPESADLLVRTEESLVIDGLAQLPAASLQALGVRRIPGVDAAFITIGKSEVDSIVDALLAAADQRRGEVEKGGKKKARGKVKEVA